MSCAHCEQVRCSMFPSASRKIRLPESSPSHVSLKKTKVICQMRGWIKERTSGWHHLCSLLSQISVSNLGRIWRWKEEGNDVTLAFVEFYPHPHPCLVSSLPPTLKFISCHVNFILIWALKWMLKLLWKREWRSDDSQTHFTFVPLSEFVDRILSPKKVNHWWRGRNPRRNPSSVRKTGYRL
jgi:hypothetical protein